MKNHGAHKLGQEPPSLDLQERAITSAKNHPHFREASSHPYCNPLVVVEPKDFVKTSRFGPDIKDRVATALSDEENVILVLFFTAARRPEPLCGGGNSYEFLVHPKTFEVLHASTGTWMS
jgi:hypothetical protein